jgi:hypothetical protein
MSASGQDSVKDASVDVASDTRPSDTHPSDRAPTSVSFDSPGAVAAFVAFTSATHEVLFDADDARDACDVCGERVLDDEDGGPALSGRGLYLWTRGEETRHEEAPLCPSCASALGLTALARWEIDEEEG